MWDIKKFINESNNSIGKMCEMRFSYNSGNNDEFLTVNDLRKLINELEFL